MRDVARQARVSSATVSRVLNGHPKVNGEARARVLAAAAELGFQPNRMARSLRTGRGHSVALLVGDIEQKLYSALTKHVQVALGQIGLDVLVYNLDHSAERLRSFLDTAPALGLRGLALATTDEIDAAIDARLHGLQAAGITVVSLTQRLEGRGIPSIVHEEEEAGQRAVAYLLEAGRAPVLFVARITGSAIGSARYRGYAAAMRAAGLAELVCDTAYRFPAGYQAVSQTLDAGQRFGAVQAGSDEIALGAMAALHDRGLRVPDDVAVVGFGDIDWGAHIRPALTTLSVHHETTASLLRDLLQAPPEAAGVTVIPRRLIRRGTA